MLFVSLNSYILFFKVRRREIGGVFVWLNLMFKMKKVDFSEDYNKGDLNIILSVLEFYFV